MDGLALLCNLHADGPLTLRRLREAGVGDLETLVAFPEAALARLLRTSSTQARRFGEEARQLARRLLEVPLEPETGPEQLAPRGIVHADTTRRVAPDPAPVPVLRARTAPAIRAYGCDRAGQARLEPAGALPASAGTPLGSVPVEGLDRRTCELLVAQGVRTLEALVDLANLSLARRAGIPFTRLLELSHRARQFLAEGRTDARSLSSGSRPSGPLESALESPSEPPFETQFDTPFDTEVELVPSHPRGERSFEELRASARPALVSPRAPFPREPSRGVGDRADEEQRSASTLADRAEDPGSAGPFV
jgi:hypothetical protein